VTLTIATRRIEPRLSNLEPRVRDLAVLDFVDREYVDFAWTFGERASDDLAVDRPCRFERSPPAKIRRTEASKKTN